MAENAEIMEALRDHLAQKLKELDGVIGCGGQWKALPLTSFALGTICPNWLWSHVTHSALSCPCSRNATRRPTSE
jgi:hypothetical protein